MTYNLTADGKGVLATRVHTIIMSLQLNVTVRLCDPVKIPQTMFCGTTHVNLCDDRNWQQTDTVVLDLAVSLTLSMEIGKQFEYSKPRANQLTLHHIDIVHGEC